MPLDLNHFAQVARHPDGDRLVVMENAAVRTRRQDDPGAQFNSRRVVAGFRESARARYGSNLKGAEHLNHLERNGLPLRARDVRQVILLNRPASGGHLPAPHPSRPLHVVLVGGGPSSSLQVCAEIDLLTQPRIQEDLKSVMSLGGDAYLKELQKIPAFNPPGSKEYFDRFVDFPAQVHREVYARALEEARDTLSTTQSRAA